MIPPRTDDPAYDFLAFVESGDLRGDEDAWRAVCARAGALGVEPSRVLVTSGRIAAADLVAALARHHGLGHLDRAELGRLVFHPGEAGALPRFATAVDRGNAFLHILDAERIPPRDIEGIVARLRAGPGRIRVSLVDSATLRQAVLASHGGRLLKAAASGARLRRAESCARDGPAIWQVVVIATLAGLALGALPFAAGLVATLAAGAFTLGFFPVVALRLAALVASIARRRPPLPPPLADHDLPHYTLLVPLYREARVVADLARALRLIDYPPEKLDVKLLLEASDAETRAAVAALELGPPFEILIVPDLHPRTKPKALDYALAFSRGDLVTVFDAEDVPAPGQLRLAAAAFAAGPADLACLQARLAIDNAADGWLARQFAIEYLALFDGLLPALSALGLPVPLGGTSNHFRKAALLRAGAWDPFNVTEDADLGVRLARLGWTTAMLDSTTSEEAPFRPLGWLRQRTRWLKGWMQTYAVHMRRPGRLLADLGLWRFLGFHLVIGGQVLSALAHPVFFAWLVLQAASGELLAPPEGIVASAFWWLAAVNLVLGYATAVVLALLAILRARCWRLLPSAVFMPLYWLLVSLAAYRALWQLVRDPFLWEKTEHGISRRRTTAAPRPHTSERRF
ncbi:MAG: glycosyltransferase [Hyphomicrobiaceae bacterium]